MKKYFLFTNILTILLVITIQLSAQVSISPDNNSIADPSAMLDVKSTTKGVVFPRMTQAQIGAISNPTNGLVVFCTTDNKFYAFVAGANIWKEILYGSGTITVGSGSFSCGMAFIDSRDGKSYNTVLIGSQCWMAQNLNVGIKIAGSGEQTNNSIIEKYCYNDDENNCTIYGGLYQWDEAMQYTTIPGVKGICPTGWHLPTDAEWTTLTTFLGGEAIAGGKMKEAGLAHWLSPNTGATNSSGFTALPGGLKLNSGFFDSRTISAHFWSSSQFDASNAWNRHLGYDRMNVGRDYDPKTLGYSTRCLKD